METRYPSVYIDRLGRQLSVWEQYGIADSHALKLLRLWTGYGLTQYMDAQGRYTFHSFNQLRKEIGYPSVQMMIDDLRRCRSFVLLSSDVDTTLLRNNHLFLHSRPERELPDHITMFFSPVWHTWEEKDGYPLPGSIEMSQKKSQNLDANYNNTCYNKNLTGSTAGAVEAVQPASGQEVPMSISDIEAEQKRELLHAIAHAKAYFRGLIQNAQAAQREPMEMLLYRFQQPLTPEKGQAKGFGLTPEQAHELLLLMIDKELAPHFARDRQFMSPHRIKDPSQRIYQVKNYIKKYSTDMATRSYRQWLKQNAEKERAAAQLATQQRRQQRPISPHEWQEPDGSRYYDDPADGLMLIPADAPPRPSAEAHWNKFASSWVDHIHK